MNHKNEIHGAPREQWFTICDGLREWQCETPQRNTKNHVDKVDYKIFLRILLILYYLPFATNV